jgi:hypothetical protein
MTGTVSNVWLVVVRVAQRAALTTTNHTSRTPADDYGRTSINLAE